MQRVELLPPSYFSLAPPSTFQPSVVVLAPSPGPPQKRPPSSPDRASTFAAGATYSAAQKTEDGGSKAVSLQPSKWRQNERAAVSVGQLTRHQLIEGRERCRQDLRTSSRPSETPTLEERKDAHLNWLSANRHRSRHEAPSYHHGLQHDAATRLPSYVYSSDTTEEENARLRQSSRPKRAVVSPERRDHGFRDNAEEELARKLAMCQKIDKSLQFYADVRKKWSDGPDSSSSTSQTPPSTATSTQNSSTHTREEKAGAPPHTDACAVIPRNLAPPTAQKVAEQKERVRARESAPRSHRVLKDLSKRAANHSQRTSDTSGYWKTREDGRKPTCGREISDRQVKHGSRPPLNDLSRLPPSRTWSQTITGTSKKNPTLTLRLVQRKQGGPGGGNECARNALRTLGSNSVEVPSGPQEKVPIPQKVEPHHKVDSVQESTSPVVPTNLADKKKDTLTKVPVTSSPTNSAVAKESEDSAIVKGDKQTAVTKGGKETAVAKEDEEREEDFNDFDSVQEDSDCESVEPLTGGAFGEPFLTGAQSVLPPSSPAISTELAAAGHNPTTPEQTSATSESGVRETLGHKQTTLHQSSPEFESLAQENLTVDPKQITLQRSSPGSDSGVKEKPVPLPSSDTVCDRGVRAEKQVSNDTVLARVLQAEEDSRASVLVTPNTSSDFAIAKQIQEDLNQLSLDEEEDEEEEEEELPPGAVGVGLPDMSNFEGLRFPSDDPNYYGTGYEIGGEYMVTQHNSLSLEQTERNRNIPRKSIRRNNYTGRWDDEYRYRGFDKRGYRNLSTERIQPHERKTWAVGGTGIVTACVRDMRRSDTLLEREEIDLAFEGRQELEEIKSSIDSQLIERMSHQYEYKEKHRPKDPSVKPVTECAICLEDFKVGDPLRLMPCSHTFHRFCVDKWLEENENCAVCKADYHLLAGKLGLNVDLEKYGKRW